VAIPEEIIVAITTFATHYTIWIGRENVGFRPGRWSRWTRHRGPLFRQFLGSGGRRGSGTGDDGGVVINTGAADGDGWSGVAQAGNGGPNGESCAVGGELRVDNHAASSGIGVAPCSSAAGGGSGGDGIADAGFRFIGGAWRQ
jgi:hypothetical protein